MLDSRENTKVPLGVSCWKSALGVPGWGVPPTGGAKLHSLFWARKLLGAGCPWMGQLKKHLWASYADSSSESACWMGIYMCSWGTPGMYYACEEQVQRHRAVPSGAPGCVVLSYSTLETPLGWQ